MCGIVGALSFNSTKITNDYIVSLRDTLLHRGPDGMGVYVSEDGLIGLGHRRLSIIDLSETANQPMSTIDQSLYIVFNGEIYNHSEIKLELQNRGYHDWKTTHSDTEVILYAFKEWGIDCVHKLRGMFAFSIWDDANKTLWLVRDRIGIKPLYYSLHSNRIVFASEIKALLKDPNQKRAVNEEGLFHYLSFLTTPSPITLFEGIKKLPPATWLRITLKGDITERRYWDVWDNVKPNTGNEDEIANELLENLREAVKYRKISDVPVGVFLSGGIDSSTNAVLFSEDENIPIKTFSIGYEGNHASYQNEFAYAKQVANLIGSDHYQQKLSLDDLLNFLPQMIYFQDEPLADPVCFPVYYVSKLAKDNGITVAQVGEGADELFWGYRSWKAKYALQKLANIPGTSILKNISMLGFNLFGLKSSMQYEFLKRTVNHHPIFWGGAEAFTSTLKHSILSPRLKNKFKHRTSWEVIEPIWNRFNTNASEKSILNWMSYMDLSYRLPELLLMRVDKMSMAVSLEGRVPFLDHKFVEFAFGIPSHMKTKHNELKSILKKAVRHTIPDEIIDRPKQGFGVPINEWFLDKLGPLMRKDIINFCKNTDYFEYSAIEQLFNQKQSSLIWYLYNFVLWHNRFIESPI